MKLPGILPASVRILFPATPRRSPLRRMLHDTSGQSPQSLMTASGLTKRQDTGTSPRKKRYLILAKAAKVEDLNSMKSRW